MAKCYEVINLHFLDMCNFNCTYCFRINHKKMLSLDHAKKIIIKIKEYFDFYGVKGRINLVGGEIFVCGYLQDIIDFIYERNIEVSIVSNGYLITEDFIANNAKKISTIGISCDSFNEDTNKKIGRCNSDNTLSNEHLLSICECIKKHNIKLKINICVSILNHLEDFSYYLDLIKPDRLKILQMSIVEQANKDSEDLLITNEEFITFCDKLKKFSPAAETSDELLSSYIMIDSKGDLCSNENKELKFSLLEEDIFDSLSKIEMDFSIYKKRHNIKD